MCLSQEVPDDQYYDDYYEEDEQAAEVDATGGATFTQVQPVIGFLKPAGGGISKIIKPLVDDEYLNMTVEVYDCVKRIDSGILALEPNTTEDEEPDITQQVNDLRKKMEAVVSVAAALANGTDPNQNATAVNDTTVNTGIIEEIPSPQQAKVKRLSFREKQEQRMKERREQEAARELLRPKFRLGADCETLACGSCKAIVEEFGAAAQTAAKDPKVRYVEEVLEGFCARKEVKLKYIDIVSDICARMEQVPLRNPPSIVALLISVLCCARRKTLGTGRRWCGRSSRTITGTSSPHQAASTPRNSRCALDTPPILFQHMKFVPIAGLRGEICVL